jgi:5-formyltetrahydrofolate cyclo-ligase
MNAPGGVPPNLAAWRQAMREELIARRMAAPAQARREWSLAISLLLMQALPVQAGSIVGCYWPLKAEYDARPLMRLLRQRGARSALPVVMQRAEPLVYRQWQPGVPMKIGTLGIAHPVGTEQVAPHILLVPLVGFGRAGDRLGYGGGYFDRTLAAMEPRPLSIGVGFELSRMETSFPQAHDVPLDAIATEAGLRWRMHNALEEVTPRGLRERLQELARTRADFARLTAHTVPGLFP